MRKKTDKSRDLTVLKRFTEVYCKAHHGARRRALCGECSELLEYARERLEKCPYDPKPKCKDCETHCYRPDQRQRVREIMRYAGIHFVKRGRLDWMVRYFMMDRGRKNRE